MKNDEIKTINIQIIATYLFIISLIISLLLTYNDKFKTLNKKEIFTEKKTYQISVFNRFFVLVLSLTFLYINYLNYQASKKEKKDLSPFTLQLAASELSVLASVIVLYVVIISGNYSIISSVENPNL